MPPRRWGRGSSTATDELPSNGESTAAVHAIPSNGEESTAKAVGETIEGAKQKSSSSGSRRRAVDDVIKPSTSPSELIDVESAVKLAAAAEPGPCGNEAGRFAASAMKSELARCDVALCNDLLAAVRGGCVYLPSFFSSEADDRLFKRLVADLTERAKAAEADEKAGGAGEGGLVDWSKHLKLEDPDFSETFRAVEARMAEYFDVEIFVTRMNFYRDGSDWKPYHHDSHAYAPDGQGKEDFTMGASFGFARELSILHEASGQVFNFPQRNGDVFAFDSEINRQFLHGVPRSRGNVGPRISIIAWGRRRCLNERNSQLRGQAAGSGGYVHSGPIGWPAFERADKDESTSACNGGVRKNERWGREPRRATAK
eukprot:TRINITY_DN35667_c0_g1_i1.p1 TRINITY_DN35667_c0_g1~~TRINITY_DN35667_c0_g1_i1.p1  ORF type:complete len:370 (-),score=77.35 TRINITY_DN35667_c0_g1_i1:127-1236(-)